MGPLHAVQLVVNGSFEEGLDGWMHTGEVTASSEFAVLQEDSAPGSSSAIFQTVGTGGDPLLLSFDLFVGGMSMSVPDGTLADSAFGSLYFGEVAFGSDATAGSYSERLDLFDLDRTGLSILTNEIRLRPLLTRAGWVNLTLPVTSPLPFVTLVIEEIDLNFTPGDSVVALDEVSMFVVPEPSTVLSLLLSIGFFLMTTRRRLP